MKLERSNWSGEGELTQQLVDWFSRQSTIRMLRVEDAPSSRSDVEYNFISNEIYIHFEARIRVERRYFLRIFPVNKSVQEKVMTFNRLEAELAADVDIGPPDYVDEAMIQYLHTDRIIPPYQTKGYKMVELVRIYEYGTESRSK